MLCMRTTRYGVPVGLHLCCNCVASQYTLVPLPILTVCKFVRVLTSSLITRCSRLRQAIARSLIYEEADVNLADENGVSPMQLGADGSKNRISPALLSKMITDGESYRRRRHLQDPVTKAKITKAVALFNNKPLKGLRMLVDEGVLEDSPQQMAEFLITQEKLEKVAIGEILSEQNQGDLLTAFVDMMDFGGMDVRGAWPFCDRRDSGDV